MSLFTVTILSLKYTGSRSKSILYEVLKQLRGQIWEAHFKTVETLRTQEALMVVIINSL